MTQPAELTSVGYIGIRSERLDDWDSYATRLLGMQQVDRGGAVRAFRMDDRKQRLVVAGDRASARPRRLLRCEAFRLLGPSRVDRV